MIIHLHVIGVLLVALGLVHVIFPAYFKWKAELKGISLITRQILHVHTLFIALTVVLMGVLCITSAEELVRTVLGKRIACGLFVFWLTRCLIQFFGYSSQLWRGKRFETFVHICFSLFWCYLTVVFGMVAFMK